MEPGFFSREQAFEEYSRYRRRARGRAGEAMNPFEHGSNPGFQNWYQDHYNDGPRNPDYMNNFNDWNYRGFAPPMGEYHEGGFNNQNNHDMPYDDPRESYGFDYINGRWSRGRDNVWHNRGRFNHTRGRGTCTSQSGDGASVKKEPVDSTKTQDQLQKDTTAAQQDEPAVKCKVETEDSYEAKNSSGSVPNPTDSSEPNPTDCSESNPTDCSEPNPTDSSDPNPTEDSENTAMNTETAKDVTDVIQVKQEVEDDDDTDDEDEKTRAINKLPSQHVRGLMSTLIGLVGPEVQNKKPDPLPKPQPMKLKDEAETYLGTGNHKKVTNINKYALPENMVEEDNMEADDNLEDRDLMPEDIGREIEKPEFYCSLCEKQTTSLKNFHDHLNGKGHKSTLEALKIGKKSTKLKKKGTKDWSEVGKKSLCLEVAKDATEPILGLSSITEYHSVTGVVCVCNLCAAKFDFNIVVSHVCGNKHRLRYMKEKKPDVYIHLKKFGGKKSRLSAFLSELSQQVEMEDGRGVPVIKLYEPAKKQADDVQNLETDQSLRESRLRKLAGESDGETIDFHCWISQEVQRCKEVYESGKRSASPASKIDDDQFRHQFQSGRQRAPSSPPERRDGSYQSRDSARPPERQDRSYPSRDTARPPERQDRSYQSRDSARPPERQDRSYLNRDFAHPPERQDGAYQSRDFAHPPERQDGSYPNRDFAHPPERQDGAYPSRDSAPYLPNHLQGPYPYPHFPPTPNPLPLLDMRGPYPDPLYQIDRFDRDLVNQFIPRPEHQFLPDSRTRVVETHLDPDPVRRLQNIAARLGSNPPQTTKINSVVPANTPALIDYGHSRKTNSVGSTSQSSTNNKADVWENDIQNILGDRGKQEIFALDSLAVLSTTYSSPEKSPPRPIQIQPANKLPFSKSYLEMEFQKRPNMSKFVSDTKESLTVRSKRNKESDSSHHRTTNKSETSSKYSKIPAESGRRYSHHSNHSRSRSPDVSRPRRSRSPVVSRPRRSRSPDVSRPRRSRSPDVSRPRRSRSPDVSRPRRSRSPDVSRPRRSRSPDVSRPRRSRSSDVSRPWRSKSPDVLRPRRSRSPGVSRPRRSRSPGVSRPQPKSPVHHSLAGANGSSVKNSERKHGRVSPVHPRPVLKRRRSRSPNTSSSPVRSTARPPLLDQVKEEAQESLTQMNTDTEAERIANLLLEISSKLTGQEDALTALQTLFSSSDLTSALLATKDILDTSDKQASAEHAQSNKDRSVRHTVSAEHSSKYAVTEKSARYVSPEMPKRYTERHSRSPGQSSRYSASPEKSLQRSRSPDKFSRYDKSLVKPSRFSKSTKSSRYSRSPEKKSLRYSRSPDIFVPVTIKCKSPEKPSRYSKHPGKLGNSTYKHIPKSSTHKINLGSNYVGSSKPTSPPPSRDRVAFSLSGPNRVSGTVHRSTLPGDFADDSDDDSS